MKRYIYCRVSTEKQDYAQQKECIFDYFRRHGIDPESIEETIVEHESGTKDYKERLLSDLLDKCEAGDIIYISELSRLSRSMSDLFEVVTKICNKGKSEAEKEEKRTGQPKAYGANIIQCKDGTSIENNSIGGKALLFALSLAAEIEVKNIRHRTRMGLSARLEEKERNGFWISKSGNVRTHLGNAAGCDMERAHAAASEAARRRKSEWKDNSAAYKLVRRKLMDGWTPEMIVREVDEHEADNAGQYLTRTGKRVNEAVVRSWKREIMGAAMMGA